MHRWTRPSDNFESPESFQYYGAYYTESRSVRAVPKPSEHRIRAVPMGNSILAQCRKPSGWLGRFLLWKMNRQHSQLTDWGLTHIPIGQNDTILDVGCGGGRTVSKLAAAATQARFMVSTTPPRVSRHRRETMHVPSRAATSRSARNRSRNCRFPMACWTW